MALDVLVDDFKALIEKDEQAHLLRRLSKSLLPQTEHCILCANDYLGFSQHPQVIHAAKQATHEYGAGARAARTLHGTSHLHLELESAISEWKETEAALLFPTGYMAAIGLISTVAQPGDLILIDRSCHSCLFDGAKLSGASVRVFGLQSINDLQLALEHNEKHHPGRRTFIIVESLYSMDGDFAPLNEIYECADRYHATLIVDEAHANGVWGPEGSGCIRENHLPRNSVFQLGTLGKSLGASGGFVAGPQLLIQYLMQRSRSFLFTTAAPPSVIASALTALRLCQTDLGKERRNRLKERVEHARTKLAPEINVQSQIIPIPVQNEEACQQMGAQLENEGIFVSVVRSPTVPLGSARLRLSLHSELELPAFDSALNRMTSLISDHNDLIESKA